MAQPDGTDDLVSTLIAGVAEALPSLDDVLPRLERNPADIQALAGMQQLVQTVGNTCGFLALPRLNALARAGALFLDALQSAAAQATTQTTGLVAELADALKSQVQAVRRSGAEQAGEDAGLLERLQRASTGARAEETPSTGVMPPGLSHFFEAATVPEVQAAIPALIVEAQGTAIAIPYTGILEVVQVAPGAKHCIEMLYDAPVMRRGEASLPLGSLAQLLGLQSEVAWEAQAAFVVVCRVAGCEFGLIVDRAQDAADITVLPVSPLLETIPLYSGNAILKEGRVVMVLNVRAVAKKIGYGEAGEAAESAGPLQPSRRNFLLITAGGVPKAVPLERVERLEALDVQAIGIAGGTPVVRSRRGPMRLVMASDGMRLPDAGQMEVVVCMHGEKTVGLVAESIDDIAQAAFDILLPSQRKGCTGSMMIGGRAVDVVDVARLFVEDVQPAHEEYVA